MSIYHCSIKIISRSGGRSAVSSAAYRSGEKSYNDETGIIHDFTNKGGVIMNEIILPENAPERYHEREILWNEVQQVEKKSDAQFAREIEVALPIEISREEHIECTRKYIKENFIDKGMIADWALHDKTDGNPHAHIMLTMRGIDEYEEWLKKQKTVFANARDEQGRAIYNPELPMYDPKDRENTFKYRIPVLDKNGEQKTRVRNGKGTEYLWEKISITLNDWNDHSQAELWRSSWADHCNKYLDKEHQIDHRSYERQGIDKEPTIHEGVTARQIEVEGKVADRCQINREIKERNSIREQLKELARDLTQIITEKARSIYGRFKEFRGSLGHLEHAISDGGDIGKSANGDRKSDNRKSELEGTIGRIHEFKRAVDKTDKEAEKTDREIVVTDQRITELHEAINKREVDRNERLRKLKERRSASLNDGGDARSDRGFAESTSKGSREELRSTKEDIAAFITNLNAKERGAEKKRENRENERERSHIEEERKIGEADNRSSGKREESTRRRQSHGRSR
jgi:hypothetical protein